MERVIEPNHWAESWGHTERGQRREEKDERKNFTERKTEEQSAEETWTEIKRGVRLEQMFPLWKVLRVESLYQQIISHQLSCPLWYRPADYTELYLQYVHYCESISIQISIHRLYCTFLSLSARTPCLWCGDACVHVLDYVYLDHVRFSYLYLQSQQGGVRWLPPLLCTCVCVCACEFEHMFIFSPWHK